MSDAISLLSALLPAPSGGQGVRAAARDGFAALFQGGGQSGRAETGGLAAPAPVQVQKMYNFLAGLGKRAAMLDPGSMAPAEVLETVAGLASDLAGALAGFERDFGLGLVPALKARMSGGADLGPEPAGEAGRAAPADPAAAIAALQSVIAAVARVLRDVSSGAVLPQELGGMQAAPSSVSAALIQPARTDRSTAGEAPDGRAGGASGTIPQAGSGRVVEAAAWMASGSEHAAAPAGGTPASGAEAPLIFVPGRNARPETLAGQALLMRVVEAVEANVAEGAKPATASANALAGSVAGLAPEPVGSRRFGPEERLISPEDVARAMARESLPGRDAGPTEQARPAQGGTEQPRFAAALTAQVRSAEIGEGRTRIELSPSGLGSIEVDVTTGEDGALKVVVRAENPAVLNSLRSERDLLAQALGGLDAGSLDLQSFSDGPGQEPRDTGARAATMAADGAAEAGNDPEPVRIAEIGGGRLDIVT